jgi:hypothetical protein
LEAFKMMPQSVNNANWFTYEFWRFVLVQEVVARYAQSFIDFPPNWPGGTGGARTLAGQPVRRLTPAQNEAPTPSSASPD